MWIRLPLVVVVSFLAGCSSPVGEALQGHIELEDGITRLHLERADLASFLVPSGESERSFDLRALEPTEAFNRVGVRWDAERRGGMTQVQVRVAGTADWLAVHVDDEQPLADGRTIYAGHVDVPAGAKLESRLRGVRGTSGSDSPVFTSVTIEVFDRGVIEEYGEVQGGDGAGPDAATEAPVDTLPGEHAPTLPAGALASMSAVVEPTVVSRESWGARQPRCQGAAMTPYRMTFHHTETSNGERGEAARARMRQMQAYHQNSRGWCDIGYHLVIDADGVIYRGRTTTARTGAHVANQNTGNIGVAMMGSYASASPSQSALDGLAAAFAFLANTWGIPVSSDKIRGHNQWTGQATDCPGSPLLGLRQEILHGVQSRLDDADPTPTPMPTSTPPPTSGTPGEVVVDDSSPLFYASVNWFQSNAMPTPYLGSYRARSAESVSDPAYWAAPLQAGDYEVQVRWTAGSNRARWAPYFVFHKYGTATVYADQAVNGSQWMTLGTYTFNGGTIDRVALSCWTNSGDFVIADAVRFVPR